MIEAPAINNILGQLTTDEALNGIHAFCKENNFGFAAWRAPESKEISLIIDDSKDWSLPNVQLEELKEGFIFCPFDKSQDKYFIKSNLKISLSPLEIEGNTQLTTEITDYLSSNSKTSTTQIRPEITEKTGNAIPYENLVSKSIEAIQQGKFQKVVPSRCKQIDLDNNFNIGAFFLKLEKLYTNSFISIAYTPKTNLWIGATPEVLIQSKNNTFQTVALAGTQAYNPSMNVADTSWTQKEIEEQAFVCRYIINSFKQIRLRDFEEHGPKTVIAGNLMHLKTTFNVDMEATNFPNLSSTMLELLHPTSAICGMPLESATNFIKENELYDRKFFSGYLGPVNIAGETSIFVNLRCMEIIGEKANLYAGAGVTENSNPTKEWLETEMKMNTLLNVIKN